MKVLIKDCYSPITEFLKKCSNWSGRSYPEYPFFYQCFYNGEKVSESQKSDKENIKKMAHMVIDKADKHQGKLF